jgi:hypothetical protein
MYMYFDVNIDAPWHVPCFDLQVCGAPVSKAHAVRAAATAVMAAAAYWLAYKRSELQ